MTLNGNFAQRRKNWKSGAMTPAAVDEEIHSIRLGLSQNFTDLAGVSFVTATADSTLANERVLTGTANEITVKDNGAGSTIVLSVPDPFDAPGVVNVANTKLEIGGSQSFPILQVLTFNTSTSFSTTNSTFTTTNLTGAITPKFNTSKILIWVSGDFAQQTGSSVGYATIARGSTNLAASSGGFSLTVAGNNYSTTMIAYDSPATISATTYNVQIRTNGGGTAIFPITDGGSFTSTATMIIAEIAQ